MKKKEKKPGEIVHNNVKFFFSLKRIFQINDEGMMNATKDVGFRESVANSISSNNGVFAENFHCVYSSRVFLPHLHYFSEISFPNHL